MNELINPRKSVFEQIRHVDENGVEYWSAREMAKVLEYSEYRHFLPVIEKAKEACANSNNNPLDHFEDILELDFTREMLLLLKANGPEQIDAWYDFYKNGFVR